MEKNPLPGLWLIILWLVVSTIIMVGTFSGINWQNIIAIIYQLVCITLAVGLYLRIDEARIGAIVMFGIKLAEIAYVVFAALLAGQEIPSIGVAAILPALAMLYLLHPGVRGAFRSIRRQKKGMVTPV